MKTLYEIAQNKGLSDKELLFIEQEAVKKLSLFDFSKEILGYKDVNHIHKDLCDFLETPFGSKLILMPRYSFKSTISTVAYSIWRLLREPNLRILIYSDASTKAQGFLNQIKNHFEGKIEKSYFSSLFDWSSDGRETKWNESQIVIRGRTSAFPEPSVDTGGMNTSFVGKHFDLILFDDLVSDVNTTTKEQMDKANECYQRSLSLLKPGGEIVMIGTRWHFGDLYGRIIAENSAKQSFRIFLVNGENDKKYGRYCFSDIGLTKDFLFEQRKKQGSRIYSCLYCNEPTDDETAAFKSTDFSFYGNIKPDDLYITATCDPAGEGEDFTAITVVGTDCNMDMHILDIVNKHLQPSGIIDEIMRLNEIYKFKIFGLEVNFYRGMLTHALQARIDEERKENSEFNLFGIHEFNASAKRGEGKHNRILALQPYHENKAIKFPGEKLELLNGAFSDLAYQMQQFPNSRHDDILDSLAYHLDLIRKGGVVKKKELPKNSPAELELRTYNEMIRKNSCLPRRFRAYIPEPSLS